MWLPTFLNDEFDLGLGQATLVVATVIIANAPGNWLGGYLSQRGLAPAQLILGSGLVMGVTGWAAFSADVGPALRFALCLGFSFIGGGFMPCRGDRPPTSSRPVIPAGRLLE